MKYIILLLLFCNVANAQIKKAFKFSTFYVATNGGTSLSDRDVYSIDGSALVYDTIFTPFDYSLTMGIRKIKRFPYEARTQFKDGLETSFSDAASVGLSPFEYLFELDYRRQEGVEYFDQNHFLRYVKPLWLAKVEYLKEGFADIEYFESTARLRINSKKKISFNIGAVNRLAEPYGYDPLEEWTNNIGNVHYTQLAIQEGYSIDVFQSEYKDPNGNVVANNSAIWEEIVIPTVLKNYVDKKRNELPQQLQNSLVVGFDFIIIRKTSGYIHGVI